MAAEILFFVLALVWLKKDCSGQHGAIGISA